MAYPPSTRQFGSWNATIVNGLLLPASPALGGFGPFASQVLSVRTPSPARPSICCASGSQTGESPAPALNSSCSDTALETNRSGPCRDTRQSFAIGRFGRFGRSSRLSAGCATVYKPLTWTFAGSRNVAMCLMPADNSRDKGGND